MIKLVKWLTDFSGIHFCWVLTKIIKQHFSSTDYFLSLVYCKFGYCMHNGQFFCISDSAHLQRDYTQEHMPAKHNLTGNRIYTKSYQQIIVSQSFVRILMNWKDTISVSLCGAGYLLYSCQQEYAIFIISSYNISRNRVKTTQTFEKLNHIFIFT